MPTLHPTASFNVHATLNKWLSDGLAAISRPSWLPAYSLVLNLPEALLTFPSFGVEHRPFKAESDPVGQGKNPGLRAAGALQVTAYVRRAPDWQAQLNTLTSMVESLVAADTRLTLYNYQANPASPASTAYQLEITHLEVGAIETHANPDIHFRRLLIHYTWILRAE